MRKMIQIGETLISDDIVEEPFLCDLCACKGQCCVDGESGAPLTDEESEQIRGILPVIWDDLSPAAKALIGQQGIDYIDYDGERVTSIINGKECVFTCFDEEGVCRCVIDKAYREGRIDVQKPISCHLYPIRLQEYDDYTAINYHRWSVCRSAVKEGKRAGVPVYRFLKEPLIRKFGEAWYRELCEVAEEWKHFR